MARRHGAIVTRCFVDGFDLSGDSSAIDINISFDNADVSGYGNTHKHYVLGARDVAVTHNGFYDDTATTGIHAVMEPRLGSATVLSVLMGTAIGNYGFSGSAMFLQNYSLNASTGGAVTLTANYTNKGGMPGLDPVRIAAPNVSISGGQAAIDDGSSSSNGVRAYLHVTGVTSGTITPILQHSATGTSAWADLVTFSSYTARGAESIAVTGTVNRYIRATTSAGTGTFELTYYRL